MKEDLFAEQQDVKARAIFVGQRIDVRAFEQQEQLSAMPLTVSAGRNGVAVLFRYGVVVLFGMDSAEIVGFMDNIARLIVEPFENPEWDDTELSRQPGSNEGVEPGRIRLHAFNLQRLQVVAHVMAKSVVLAHYEVSLNSHFDRIEPLSTSLSRGGRVSHEAKTLLKYIGDILLIESKMVGRVEVVEKPELIWDYPEYERLYLRLEDEYELEERHTALDRKLRLISNTARTMLSILQDKRTLRVEWYIVILIVIEIVITLIEKIV